MLILSSDVQIKSIASREFLDVLYKGFVFRLRIYTDNEVSLLMPRAAPVKRPLAAAAGELGGPTAIYAFMPVYIYAYMLYMCISVLSLSLSHSLSVCLSLSLLHMLTLVEQRAAARRRRPLGRQQCLRSRLRRTPS